VAGSAGEGSLLVDAPLLMAVDARGQRVGVSSVHVRQGAVAAAYRRDPQAVADLVECGAEPHVEPRVHPLVQLGRWLTGTLWTTVQTTTTSLPLGLLATVVGRATVADGRVTLAFGDKAGLFLFRNSVDSVVAGLARSQRMWSVAAVGYFALSLIPTWQALRHLVPGVPSLRRIIAEGAREVLGVRLPRWEREHGGWLFADAPGRGGGGAGGTSSLRRTATDRSGDRSPASPGGGGGATPQFHAVHPADTPAPSPAQECIACAERRIVSVLMPCGHMCLCMTCAHRIRGASSRSQRKCPICRADIEQVVRAYTVDNEIGGGGGGEAGGRSPAPPATPTT